MKRLWFIASVSLLLLTTLLVYSFICAQSIDFQQFQLVKKPLSFPIKRKLLTLQYIREHYDQSANSILINPKIIVVHWTGSNNLNGVFNQLDSPTLPKHSESIVKKAGELNVSSHFLVARDGTIYQLMPEIWMARHTIGLNRHAIGIENIGGPDSPLTSDQLNANTLLVDYLVNKFPDIKYLIGHYQYLSFYESPYWEEKDYNYYTIKTDPGKAFMQALYSKTRYLLLLNQYIKN